MEPYKIRLKEEIKQLSEKTAKLCKVLQAYAPCKDSKELAFKVLGFYPTCSYYLLHAQLSAMSAYLNILLERAEIEGIDI